eukprot:9972449-Lingulodinium_polyedra.AAC.1
MDEAERPGEFGRWRPVTRYQTAPGQAILAQTGEEDACIWPFDGPSWAPAPREVLEDDASAERRVA